MLTVLVSTCLIHRYLLLKNVSSLATDIFFSKNIRVYAIFNDQSFNNTLTNNIVIYEQLDPICLSHVYTVITDNVYILY